MLEVAAAIATLEWVDGYNHERLHSACEKRPPAEYEARHMQTVASHA